MCQIAKADLPDELRSIGRRELILAALATFVTPAAGSAPDYPTSVAGVELPTTEVAMLHDLGLLRAYEHDSLPFEIVSANAAEKLARRAGLSAKDARRIWDAAVMHDMRWSFIERQTPEVMLVASGAGADVVGPDPDMISAHDTAEVVRTVPRLGFKNNFKKLLTAHCLAQPGSQDGTWLDNCCRLRRVPAKSRKRPWPSTKRLFLIEFGRFRTVAATQKVDKRVK